MTTTRSLLMLMTLVPVSSWATPVSECFEGGDCTASCESRADPFRNPVSPLTIFTGGQCTLHNTVSVRDEVGCDCSIGFAWYVLARAGYGDCLQPGRVPGTCLYTASEFPGCEFDGGTSRCAGPCGDLQARMNAEESRTFDASVLGSACNVSGSGCGSYGTCDCALHVEGTCFVSGGGMTPTTLQDCSMTPEQMISLHRAANARGCGCSSASPAALVTLSLGFMALRRRERERTRSP
jgi:MYXO-CTERM domain-containing protein